MMEGVVNVLKPPGMTSSNVVSDIRRVFAFKRVGHTGTLDPGAAGVLPVCLGRATRLFDLLVDKQKEYIAEIAFGACTDTMDSYGAVVATSAAQVSREALEAALPSFLGRQQQLAPAYSAVKVNGKAFYALARAGQEIPEKRREVDIYALTCLQQSGAQRFLLRIGCSRGTYVRTLCQDIGTALGACAHMSFLLRSASGNFLLENSHSIAELEALQAAGRLCEALVAMEEALCFLPAVHAGGALEKRYLQNGRLLEGQYAPGAGGLCRVYCMEEFLGVGRQEEHGLKLTLHLAKEG